MSNSIKFCGSWWHSPSLLEPMPGPWAGREIHELDIVDAWEKILDWHYSRGLNVIVTQISPHFKDRTILGWGFQYVLDFKKFPEARTFSSDFVIRNAERVSRILSLARNCGIKLLLHHYNFMAPKNFVETHPKLLKKWARNTNRDYMQDMGSQRTICDRIGTLYGNICWREKVYKDFMISVWQELFEKFPDLDGIVTTPGENQFCICDDCTVGAKDNSVPELMKARKQHAHEFLSDFVATFERIMSENDKMGIMRLWGIKNLPREEVDENLYPKTLPYLIKYRWFDAVNAGPDELVVDWIKRGYEVWVADDLWGENAGPVQWNRPEYFRELVQQSQKLGITGLLSHQNCDWETASIPGLVQQLSAECYCHYLQNPDDQSQTWINQWYQEHFGRASDLVKQAVSECAEFVLNISRIVLTGAEGYTFGMANGLFTRVGRIGNRVPDWIRGDLAEIYEYMEAARQGKWKPDIYESLYPEAQSPFALLAKMADSAKRAIDKLDKACGIVPKKVHRQLDWLGAGARLCFYQSQEYQHACRAAVLIAALEGDYPPEVRDEITSSAAKHMEQTVKAAQLEREALLDLPAGIMDFNRTLSNSVPPDYTDIARWSVLTTRRDELAQFQKMLKMESKK